MLSGKKWCGHTQLEFGLLSSVVQATSSDLQVATDKLKASNDELSHATSLNKARQASRIQAEDTTVSAKLKLQELQEEAESAKHDARREEVCAACRR